MNDTINNIYKLLIDRENFYMKQYYSNFHKDNCFLSIKELNGGIYCVKIIDEKENDINILESIEFIKTLGKPFSFNLIILSSTGYISLDLHGANKIVLNKDDYNIISCDESCIPLSNVLKQMIKKEKISIKNFLNNNIATMTLIVINIIIFLITAVLSNNIFDIDMQILKDFGAKYNKLIYEGQIWRILTYAFLHGGIIHLAFNMYALYIIGPQIQEIYGTKKYLIIYISSCITASLLGIITSPNSISVGASGGIFGLMGALLSFAILERKNIKRSYISSLIQVIFLNLVIGLSLKNIDNFGHIGGLLGGIIVGYIAYKTIKAHERK